MADYYFTRFAGLRHDIAKLVCDKVAQGATLKEISLHLSIEPRGQTIMKWVRDDCVFADAYRKAQEVARKRKDNKPEPVKRYLNGRLVLPQTIYTPEIGLLVCEELQKGLTICQIDDKLRMDGKLKGRVKSWCVAFPEFAKGYGIARKKQRVKGGMRGLETIFSEKIVECDLV